MHSTDEDFINLLQMYILVECRYSSLFFLQQATSRPYIQRCRHIHLHVFTIMAPHLNVCQSLIFIDRNGNPFSICVSQPPFSIFISKN